MNAIMFAKKHEILDSYVQLLNEHLAIFSQANDIELPKDYVAFLMLNNGGIVPEVKVDDCQLSRFYHLDNSSYYKDICIRLSEYDQIPKIYLPFLEIGELRSNGTLGISCNKKHFGKVFRHFSEDFEWEEIAPSFDALLGKIVDVPEAEYTIDYKSVIHKHVQSNRIAEVIVYLHGKGDVNFVDESANKCNTLLMTAIEHGRLKIAELLLQFGAKPDLQDQEGNGMSALHFALLSNFASQEAVQLLFQYNANFGLVGENCNTPAMHAAVYGRCLKGLHWLVTNNIGITTATTNDAAFYTVMSHQISGDKGACYDILQTLKARISINKN